jgi:hypothetical protein
MLDRGEAADHGGGGIGTVVGFDGAQVGWIAVGGIGGGGLFGDFDELVVRSCEVGVVGSGHDLAQDAAGDGAGALVVVGGLIAEAREYRVGMRGVTVFCTWLSAWFSDVC